jgi:hypothetical protein
MVKYGEYGANILGDLKKITQDITVKFMLSNT